MFVLEVHSCLPSTQIVAKERAMAGAREGLVIQALEQNAGYGRRGRVWVSPTGNLYISVVLRPPCPAARGGELSFVAAIAVATCVKDATLKWPNDVLIGNKKCAGIILETSGGKMEWVVLGIGMNVKAPPDGTACVAGTVEAMRDDILKSLQTYYALWKKEGFSPIRTTWLDLCAHPIGTLLRADGYEGFFVGLDKRGGLLLQGNGKVQCINTHDVEMLD